MIVTLAIIYSVTSFYFFITHILRNTDVTLDFKIVTDKV